MKTLTELKKMDNKGLMAELHEVQRELFKIRFETNNDQTKSTHLIGKNKKQIAQIKTLLKEKSLEKTEQNI